MRKSWFLGIAALAFAGCTGDTGPAGPAGQDFPGPPPEGYVNADGIAGGAAYSKWWSTDAGGSGIAPATTAPADFFRCKACHAWDGKGNAASYANRTGQSTLNLNRPDVAAVDLRSAALKKSFQSMFDLVQHSGARNIDASDNTHPDFSDSLTTAQTWNIVKFMCEEWVAPNLLYDIAVSGPTMYVDYSAVPPVVVAPTVTYSNVGALGDEPNGQTIYADKCASCHGVDGTTIPLGPRTLGQFFREKPNEAWFKTKFGEPGTGMAPGLVTATSDLQDLYRALANTTTFP